VERNLAVLTEQEYDLVIVGGGIFGVCAAWDAALRGLKVALLEKGDIGHATSANHYKMIHGGIRYLQHADIYRIRESVRERSAMLRTAPHLTDPLPIALPTYGHGIKGAEAMRAALYIFAALTADRNRGIKDPNQQIPVGYLMNKQKSLEMFPHLKQEGLTGTAVFYDGQIYNPPRLTLAYAQGAASRGAHIVNYVEATDLLRDGNRITGVKARDVWTDEEFDVRGKVVLNAAGPWADRLIAKHFGKGLPSTPIFSRDSYFIVRGKHVPKTLAVQGDTADPDAVLSRGNRHLFIVPWRNYTMLGVWHLVHKGHPEEFKLTYDDVSGFLDEVKRAYPGLQDVTMDDVIMWNAGLTLFGDNKPGQVNLSYGKRSILVDHKEQDNIDGLMTLVGVRYTIGRGMAEKAVDKAFNKLGYQSFPKSETEWVPVYGGNIAHFSNFLEEAKRQVPQLEAHVMDDVVRNYGTHYERVLGYAHEDASLLQPFGSTTTIRAQVLHAIREEWAQTLADVVFRRTGLATGENPGDVVLDAVANMMAGELGWDIARKEQELAQVKARFEMGTTLQQLNVKPNMMDAEEGELAPAGD